MGRVVMSTYRLEIKLVSGRHTTPSTWRVRKNLGWSGQGKPTAANIDKYVTGFERSMIDGPNKHLGIDQVTYARIVHQETGTVMAEWKRSEWRKDQPLFEAITMPKQEKHNADSHTGQQGTTG